MAAATDENQERLMAGESGQGYALSGKILLSGIIILFAVIVFLVGLHLYARWYIVRLRRRHRRSRAHVVMYADSVLPAADRGLELAVLSSLPVFLHSAAAEAELPPPECAVCLSEFEEKEIVRLLPKCNHSFHIECIDMWFQSHSTCPLCRSPVEKVLGHGEPAVQSLEPVEESNSSEPGSSSGAGLNICDTCQETTLSLVGPGKGADLVGVRVEVPPMRPEAALELTQSSPASRLAYFKRILSMGRRSPAAAASSSGVGPITPRGTGELDLESWIGESNQGISGAEGAR